MFKVPSNPNHSVIRGCIHRKLWKCTLQTRFLKCRHTVISVHPFKGEKHFEWGVKGSVQRQGGQGGAWLSLGQFLGNMGSPMGKELRKS